MAGTRSDMSKAEETAAGRADRLPVLVLGALTALILVAMVAMGVLMPTPSGPAATGPAVAPPPTPPTTTASPVTTTSFPYDLPTPGLDNWTVVPPPGARTALTAAAGALPTAASASAPVTIPAPTRPVGSRAPLAGAGSPPTTAGAAVIQSLSTDLANSQKQAATLQQMGDDFAQDYYRSQSAGDMQIKLAQISLDATVAWTLAQMYGLHAQDDQQALAYDEGKASTPMTASLQVAGHEMKVRSAKVVEAADALQEQLDAHAAQECADAYGSAGTGPCAQQEQTTAADRAAVNTDEAAVREALSECRQVGCTVSGETPPTIPAPSAPPPAH